MSLVRTSRRWLRASTWVVSLFLGYLIVSHFLVPGNARSIRGIGKSLGPVQLEHDRPKKALKLGETAILPTIEPIGDAPSSLPGSVLAVTAFDMACGNLAPSADWLNDVTGQLEATGVPHVIIGCGQSREALASFLTGNGLSAPAYYATCAQLSPRMQLHGGIRHYVLSDDRTVLDAWSGVPIFRHSERDMTAQIVHVASSRVAR